MKNHSHYVEFAFAHGGGYIELRSVLSKMSEWGRRLDLVPYRDYFFNISQLGETAFIVFAREETKSLFLLSWADQIRILSVQ